MCDVMIHFHIKVRQVFCKLSQVLQVLISFIDFFYYYFLKTSLCTSDVQNNRSSFHLHVKTIDGGRSHAADSSCPCSSARTCQLRRALFAVRISKRSGNEPTTSLISLNCPRGGGVAAPLW